MGENDRSKIIIDYKRYKQSHKTQNHPSKTQILFITFRKLQPNLFNKINTDTSNYKN